LRSLKAFLDSSLGYINYSFPVVLGRVHGVQHSELNEIWPVALFLLQLLSEPKKTRKQYGTIRTIAGAHVRRETENTCCPADLEPLLSCVNNIFTN